MYKKADNGRGCEVMMGIMGDASKFGGRERRSGGIATRRRLSDRVKYQDMSIRCSDSVRAVPSTSMSKDASAAMIFEKLSEVV